MSRGNDSLFGSEGANDGTASFGRLRLRTFRVPPIRDALIIGSKAPVSAATMKKALKLISAERFVSLEVNDAIIGSILVREALLRRVSAEMLKAVVLKRVKPVMAKTEIMAVRIDIELELSENP